MVWLVAILSPVRGTMFMYMLWFNFILGLNFIFIFLAGGGGSMVMIYKQKEIKFKQRIKLNHNIYIPSAFIDCVYRYFFFVRKSCKVLISLKRKSNDAALSYHFFHFHSIF